MGGKAPKATAEKSRRDVLHKGEKEKEREAEVQIRRSAEINRDLASDITYGGGGWRGHRGKETLMLSYARLVR